MDTTHNLSANAGQRFTLLMVADIAPDDVEAFADYESVALRVMGDYSGVLERRLRSSDGTVEAHIVSFPDESTVRAFTADPRRAAARKALEGRDVVQRVETVGDV